MAHFARVNDDNKVVEVLVTSNDAPNEGLDWLLKTFGGRWLKTSYNTIGGKHVLGGEPYRKNFAGVGYTYDSELDAFIPPKLKDEWVLDPETCLWIVPQNTETDPE